MRIGEIAVIGSNAELRKKFIASVCENLEITTGPLAIGRLPINEQLVLHLYSLPIQPEAKALSWDLFARKLLGYIVIFPWQDAASFDSLQPSLDQITLRHEAAVVVAACVANGDLSSLPIIGSEGLAITPQGKFAFYHENDPTSVKEVLLALIDLLIARTD